MSIEKNEEFRPKIVAFCCNWCSYAGADLASVLLQLVQLRRRRPGGKQPYVLLG